LSKNKITFGIHIGDKLIGERITVQARDISKTVILNRSGTHKAQQIIARNDAIAVLDRPKRAILEKKK